MTNEYAEENIGYGRPPKEHQFKKGRSGNPRGRPRGRKSIMAIINRALNDTISVQESGKRKMMTKIEAGAKQFANRVASGDPQALKTLIGFKDCPEWAEISAPSSPVNRTTVDDFLREAELMSERLLACDRLLAGENGNPPNADLSGHVPPQ
jgi:Family of unknown function (DUF5681)